MITQIVAMFSLRLGTEPELPNLIILFFAYSFAGCIMECVVLSIERKQLVINRGFVRHLPFCIIYGFGALLGYALLRPFADNLVLLFLFGAVGATVFEYLVGNLQLRLFGSFWWNYDEKPFNYKGILCLESTIGWGVLAILVVRFLHGYIAGAIDAIPNTVAGPVAALLVMAYVVDFAISARQANREKQQEISMDIIEEHTAPVMGCGEYYEEDGANVNLWK